MITESMRDTFYSSFAVGERNDSCWEYTGKSSSTGYGRLSNGRGWSSVHRLSWELHRGPIPDGMNVCHKCDNRKCVRPSHLFLGTTKDNIRDAVIKLRIKRCGEDNPSVRLNWATVDAIKRDRISGLTFVELSKKHNVSAPQACRICSGKSYRYKNSTSRRLS